MTGRALVAALIGVAGCSPEPRSPAYFEAHPAEAAKVVANCRSGAHRGAECVNAGAAVSAAARADRMATYQKSF